MASSTSSCKLVFGNLSENMFRKRNTCLVVATNCVTCRNYGVVADVIRAYPYAELAGFRYSRTGASYACPRDRGIEGSAIVKRPENITSWECNDEVDLPTIATLLTQYGIGAPIEENEYAQKSVAYSKDEDHADRLARDSKQMRFNHFFSSVKKLKEELSKSSYDYVKYVIFPAGIGQSGRVNTTWLNQYLPVLATFSDEMSKIGKICCVAIMKKNLSLLEERCVEDLYMKNLLAKFKSFEVLDETSSLINGRESAGVDVCGIY